MIGFFFSPKDFTYLLLVQSTSAGHRNKEKNHIPNKICPTVLAAGTFSA
jgi:hypothetical protein